MLGNIYILFYSNYSEASKKFFGYLQQSQINFTKLMYIKFVNIDTEYMRNTISNDTNVNIEKVPCLIEIQNDGSVNKYEDNNIYTWANNIIQHEQMLVKEKTDKEEALEEYRTNLESCGVQSKELYEKLVEYEEYIESLKTKIESMESEIQEQNAKYEIMEQEKMMNQLRHKEHIEENESVISELDIPINGKPEVHIRTDQLNFSNLKFDQPPIEENRDVTHKLNKPDNLMASAEAMQKERDTHDEKTIRKPPNFS